MHKYVKIIFALHILKLRELSKAYQTKSPKYTVTFELTALQLQKLKDLIEQSSISELKTKLKSTKVELIAPSGTAKVSNSTTIEASITASTNTASAILYH